jgi:hypothetical protein
VSHCEIRIEFNINSTEREEVRVMNDRVRNVLEGILEKFKTGDIPKAVAYSLFPIPDIPSAKWSFMNNFIMYLSGTMDARGYRQWEKAGRHVIKGAKAIHILVPRFKKVEGEIEGLDYVAMTIAGFMAKPVFKVEDTAGEPLDYRQEVILPCFPLMEKASEWGIKVKGMRINSFFLGIYSRKNQEIILATAEESIFFHELAHAAHARLMEDMNRCEHWYKEIVAELSAQALCQLIGKEPRDTLGNSYRYIDHYAKKAGLQPVSACLKVIDEVKNVLSLILDLNEITRESTTDNAEEEQYQFQRIAARGEG